MRKSVSGVGMRRVESSYLCDVLTGSAGGGGVFLNLLGTAEGALIPAAALTQPLGAQNRHA